MLVYWYKEHLIVCRSCRTFCPFPPCCTLFRLLSLASHGTELPRNFKIGPWWAIALLPLQLNADIYIHCLISLSQVAGCACQDLYPNCSLIELISLKCILCPKQCNRYWGYKNEPNRQLLSFLTMHLICRNRTKNKLSLS